MVKSQILQWPLQTLRNQQRILTILKSLEVDFVQVSFSKVSQIDIQPMCWLFPIFAPLSVNSVLISFSQVDLTSPGQEGQREFMRKKAKVLEIHNYCNVKEFLNENWIYNIQIQNFDWLWASCLHTQAVYTIGDAWKLIILELLVMCTAQACFRWFCKTGLCDPIVLITKWFNCSGH